MSLLIRHGTWAIVPLIAAAAFLYLHVFPRVYPRLLARGQDRLDGGRPDAPADDQD
jgi:hypothetical protein